MRRRSLSLAAFAAAIGALGACEIGLAPGLRSSPSSGDPSRPGCRLNVETKVATCPCALPEDLAEIPDRDDLVALDTELAPDADAATLARLTHLRTLRVSNVTPAALRAIAALPNIEQLTLTSRAPVDFRALATMQRLRSLEIVDYATEPVTARDLEPLAALPALAELTLSGPFPPASELQPMVPRAALRVHAPANWGICAVVLESCPPPSACERAAQGVKK